MKWICVLALLGSLPGCAPHLTSTQRFIRGEMEHERNYNIAQARKEARARCGGEIEIIPEMAALRGGEEASDYRCARRHPTPGS